MKEAVDRFAEVLYIEAAIVFGSWTRSGGGEWSDVDVLIVSDDVEGVDVLDRFKLVVEHRSRGADVFVYTYRELANMLKKGNPLAISALAEGIPVKLSERVAKLMEKARKGYMRVGRAWINVQR